MDPLDPMYDSDMIVYVYILGCCRYLHLSQDAERGVHAFAGFDFWVYPFVVACGVDSSCSLNHWHMRRTWEKKPGHWTPDYCKKAAILQTNMK